MHTTDRTGATRDQLMMAPRQQPQQLAVIMSGHFAQVAVS
jgi:hypothetical protein